MTAPARQFTVQVLKPDYSGVVGTLPAYSSASATWQRLGVGTASLTVAEAGPAVQMMLVNAQVCPVTLKAPGYPRWTGWVQRAESVRDTGEPGLIEASLVGDRQWLDRLIAAPVPTSPWSAQTAAEHDTRTGPIATVVRQLISANITRANAAGRNLPLAVTPAPGGDTSPNVTVQARNETLWAEVESTLRLHGYDITAALWLPGDPQPAGMTLTGATVVVDVTGGRDRRYVNFSDHAGGLKSRTVVAVAPGATHVVVGGPGEGTARVFEEVPADDGRIAALGRWGYTEVFLDATDADTTALRTQRAREKLAELAGKVSVAVQIDDRRPWKAGPDADYWVGDLCRATFSGVEVTDRIDRITVTSNTDGFTAAPQFGASTDTETADAKRARKVAELARRLAARDARR